MQASCYAAAEETIHKPGRGLRSRCDYVDHERHHRIASAKGHASVSSLSLWHSSHHELACNDHPRQHRTFCPQWINNLQLAGRRNLHLLDVATSALGGDLNKTTRCPIPLQSCQHDVSHGSLGCLKQLARHRKLKLPRYPFGCLETSGRAGCLLCRGTSCKHQPGLNDSGCDLHLHMLAAVELWTLAYVCNSGI